MGRLKVMVVVPSLTDGGTERIIALLLPYLRDDHDLHLVLFEPVFEYPSPEEVRCTVLGRRGRWSLPKLVYQLARLIRTEQPDVVCTHMTYANILASAACRMVRYRGGLIVSEHSVLTHAIKIERLLAAKRYLVRKLYPRADRVLVVSSGMGEDLIQNFNVPRESIAVIYNPIDLQRARNDALEPIDDPWLSSDETPVICAVGRLSAEKDYPTLLRAVRTCIEQTPVRLLVLGKGVELARLQKLAAELGIEESVRFVGQVRNVFAYIGRCDALMLTSTYEGFGNVLIEAMACDTPAISTDAPCGPGEIIENRVSGMLVPVGDTGALSDALVEVLQSPELAERLVEGGRRRVEEFDVSIIVQEYSALFDEAARNARARHTRAGHSQTNGRSS